MSTKIAGQVSFLIASMCTGMAAMAAYDLLRLFRWLILHSKTAIWFEDLLFGLSVSFPAFYVFYVYNDGALRWYGILTLIIGAAAYEKGISCPLRKLLTRIFGKHFPDIFGKLDKWLKKRQQHKH